MDRLFLDANILFSAAYLAGSPLRRLWDRGGVAGGPVTARRHAPELELLTSAYALEEARRNLDSPERLLRLEELMAQVRIVGEAGPEMLPSGLELRAKDVPILAAAIQAGATHLLTLDRRDFGPWLGTQVGGVLVLHPRDFLLPPSGNG